MAAMTGARYAACLAVLLAACTDDIARELKECEAAAPPAPRAAPGPRTKPGSNTIDFDSASERSFARARKDDEHIAACMRAKGYSR